MTTGLNSSMQINTSAAERPLLLDHTAMSSISEHFSLFQRAQNITSHGTVYHVRRIGMPSRLQN